MKRIAWVVIAVVSVASLLIASADTGSARVRTVKRFTPGLLLIDGSSSIKVYAVNDSAHIANITIRLDHYTDFTFAGPTKIRMGPGDAVADQFTCTDATSCEAQPVVLAPAGVMLSATYTPQTASTTPLVFNLPSGVWRTF